MWLASPDWKRDVLAAMEAQGISRAELSRRVKVSDAAITILFKPTTRQSRLVPAVNRVLGLTAPKQNSGEIDELRAELDTHWQEIDDEARSTLLHMARQLARNRR